MNYLDQLCGDLYQLLFQSLDACSCYSLVLVSTRLSAEVIQRYRPPFWHTLSIDAIRHGYIEWLEWYQTTQRRPIMLGFPQMTAAVAHGQLAMVQWLHYAAVLGTNGVSGG